MGEQTGPPAAQLLDELVSHAVGALTSDAHSIPDAIGLVPAEAGLYAVYADATTWQDLRLDDRRPESPLYVGKAERSLQARDIRTHFFTGRTGSSTVRRSFAALLRDRLELRGVPRNKHRPERPANFGLEPAADQRLTQWMHERLRLAYWIKPTTEIPLDDIETEVIRTLRPPLNLDKVERRLPALTEARRAMADDARTWTREHGFEL